MTSKIYLVKTAEAAKQFETFHSVEMEFGGETVVAVGGVTLAHHGANSENPAPCVAMFPRNYTEGLPILVSHIDLDTIGGIMAITGRKTNAATAVDFWSAAAYIDVQGPHRLMTSGFSAKTIDRINAFYAWTAANRSERSDALITDVTAQVSQTIAAIEKIIEGDENMLEAGREWYRTLSEAQESKLVGETRSVRVFVTDRVSCSAAYYSPTLGTVAAATVVLNTRFNAITIAFEDGGKAHSAEQLVKQLWGERAGGRAGIAGSPRGTEMTVGDLWTAVKVVAALYM